MKRKKSLALMLPSVLLVFGLYSAPVFARDGSDSTSSGSTFGSHDSTKANITTESTTKKVEDTAKPTEKSSDEAEVEKEAEVETEHETEAKIDKHSSELLAEIGQVQGAHHTADERQKNCQAAEHGLETKLGNLSKNAIKHQTRITNAFTMALDFQKAKNLNPANFNDLVTKAKAAQTQAASSIVVLKGLSTNLDCTSTTIPNNVAKFKAAAEQVRNDLFAYRDAVKAVLTSLEQVQGGN